MVLSFLPHPVSSHSSPVTMTKAEVTSSLSSKSSMTGVPGVSEVKSEVEKRAVRKLDINLLPILTVFFFLSFIDRTNIGNAKIAGLEADLGLTDRQYKIVVTALYVPYILSEVPANLILRHVGPRWFLPTILTVWGAITCLQGTVTNFSGLLAARFFLGMVEGPMLPCIVLYLSSFYTRQELSLRIAAFFTSTSLAGAFSGLLAAGLSKMDGVGGKSGWQWIFILEGLLTFVIGFSGYFLIPSTPAEARFLTEEEKEAITAHIERDRPVLLNGGHFHLKEVGRALISPQVVMLNIINFFDGTTIFGLAIFMPTIVNTLGFPPIRSQLLTVGPFAAAFVVTLVISWASDRYKSRTIPLVCSSVLAAIGYIMYLCTNHRFTLYGSLFLTASGVYSIPPVSCAWISNNSEPHYRRATAIASTAVFTNCGGILSTWLFPASEAPKFRNTSIINLVFILLLGLTAVANGLMLHRFNKRKQDPARRQELLAPYFESVKADSESDHSRTEEANKRAWLDLGDKHPDFKYVL
ncbi:hypothetical protein D9756_008145 [Leucocoprinus leucothites]|uniref:Major facilitator superfamily (MFS) profile domain-containing protein n=1 Tax=Leucocoprinus leucothites TaxID=201217 RepID=A0A8H5D4E4_9AGAR|nr:hypothetical protein D9756_008145 [Leucoagaricus leucothites]